MKNITGLDQSANYVEATLPFKLKTYTVATAPAAASNTGAIVYLSDGAAGSPCIAVSNGTNWLRCDTLATAAAS